MTNDNSLLKGADYIRQFAKNLTGLAGVYRMIGAGEKVLYVGKAKNLKNRVSSYVNKGPLTTRTLKMISETEKMEIITTGSEAEALLLEASLIKQLDPYYNILLKDDKSYPFIELTKHKFPQIRKTRNVKQNKKASYFGPFASVGAVNETLEILQKAFLLRPCSDSIFSHRSRPCLQYQIKRCSAPCVDKLSATDYEKLVKQAKDFLSGKSRAIQNSLANEMQKYSENMDYEKAAICRDRIQALTQVQQEQSLNNAGLHDADIIGIYQEGERFAVQIFFFRGGQHYGNRSFFPKRRSDATEENIIETVIAQFYQKHNPPAKLLLSHEPDNITLLEEALSINANYKVSISVPKQGDKRQLVEQVTNNAKHAFTMDNAERMRDAKHLEAVAKLFSLPKTPQRIEVYDNSHISGKHAVGAMIVATPDGLDKKLYRKFSFKNKHLVEGDDYGMMREVMQRRLSRLQKEDPDRSKNMWADLMLIDGGKGQVSIVREVMEELGITNLPFVGIAKGEDRNAGREQFFYDGKEPFQLEEGNPTLYYLQRLRDEAHRFAISSHRMKRKTAISKSVLDEISGIGTGRKKALLHHFGSPKAVETASLEELEKVEGISSTTAKKIYQYFN